MEKENKIAAIYCRTANDNAEKNMNQQEQKCRKIARRNNYRVIEVHRDYGTSGRNLKRSGIKRVLRLANRMEIEVLLTADPERLSRNPVDLLNVYQVLEANSVEVEFPEARKKNGGK